MALKCDTQIIHLRVLSNIWQMAKFNYDDHKDQKLTKMLGISTKNAKGCVSLKTVTFENVD